MFVGRVVVVVWGSLSVGLNWWNFRFLLPTRKPRFKMSDQGMAPVSFRVLFLAVSLSSTRSLRL
jgi:hypothetical protein